jgi:hypothetical protein
MEAGLVLLACIFAQAGDWPDCEADCFPDDDPGWFEFDFSDAPGPIGWAFNPIFLLQPPQRLRYSPLPSPQLLTELPMRRGLAPVVMGQYCGQYLSASWRDWWFGDGHAANPPPSFLS